MPRSTRRILSDPGARLAIGACAPKMLKVISAIGNSLLTKPFLIVVVSSIRRVFEQAVPQISSIDAPSFARD
jgi:hypothetical protein